MSRCWTGNSTEFTECKKHQPLVELLKQNKYKLQSIRVCRDHLLCLRLELPEMIGEIKKKKITHSQTFSHNHSLNN